MQGGLKLKLTSVDIQLARDCSSTGPRQPGAVTPSVGDWSVRAIQVTHHRRTSSRRAYDRRCRTGRVGRTSGLHYAAGPGAARLGTSGEVGPGTDVPRMLPRREDHAGSRRSWAGAERSPMDGGGTRVHVVDIDGARRRSHEPTAGWLELGLGWPESTHRWTGTPGRAASLDCSGRSKERDAGRARLDRVEGRDSRRTGPSRIQDVLLGRMVR